MARRYRALHFGNMDGKNVIYHREHRSKRGRKPKRTFGMTPYYDGRRHRWKKDAHQLFNHNNKLKNEA
jgi:hypothetical protein